eukprot:CAMPEP_0196581106 /NCGR_PEP_ID=MMETSP1081-20130531/32413_1 /TAXON_ID=36882 /ORGANISM="Pyramimonas amylifera, Strain CCMP720" /LENGTH=454 /DNA_ID=CAMNT_0041901207 /DNA_START=252 /DNA_END=1616 /DNA_ORIENTATION=+
MTESTESKSLLTELTWQELAAHNTSQDLWVAIRGKVYDLTSYQQRHPGGPRLLQLGAGRDVTHLFEAYHPLKVIDSNILDKFQVGVLTTHEYPTYPAMSPFHRTLKSRVSSFLEAKKTDAQYSHWPTQTLRVLALVGMIIGFYCLSSLGPLFLPPALANSTTLTIFFAALAGSARALIGVHTMHDSSHGCWGNMPFLWTLCGVISNDVLNGTSFYGWLHQHVLGHHQYCNTMGADPDIRPFPFRMSSDQEWAWYHRFQHIWGPMVYSLLSYSHRMEDFVFISSEKWDSIRLAPMSNETKAHFWGGKVLWAFWQLVLPLCLGVSWGHMLLAHITAEMVGSWYLGISFQVNHIAEDVEFQKANQGEDWAMMQARTTQDYGHGSPLTFLLTGGLNYQVVHHLLPGVSQLHYMDLQPIVKKTCEEFGVPYNHRPTFMNALGSHLRHLRSMGVPPKKAN